MLPILPKLTFGQIKANRTAADDFTKPGADMLDTTEKACAFLLLAPGVTQDQLDVESPVDIQSAALALFKATFTRPESPAQAAPQNP